MLVYVGWSLALGQVCLSEPLSILLSTLGSMLYISPLQGGCEDQMRYIFLILTY